MDDQDRRKLLEELQQQIGRTEPLDEKGRELLRRLDREIHALLQGPQGDAPDTVLEQLQENIEHFEQTHPTLALTLSQMLTVLSNAGI